MRKIFTSLKSVVSAVIIAAMALSVSCSYDDTAINDRVDQVENDLKALTERVDALEKKLGAEVESLKALIDQKVVIVDVTEDTDGNTVIKLSDGKTLTVLAAQNALQYRVVDGVLEVSADGENWVAVKVAPEQVVADVVLNEDGTATVKLANGEEFTVVKAELIECEAAKSGVYVLPDSVKEVAFSVNDAVVDINVMNQPLGWSATVEEAVEAPEAPEAGDEGGAAPMPLAAGGKDYVLKINGPAADFKQAAKTGVVSVHFNTAAGACKVLQVNVTLAELTIDVDADGNITITNSIAFEQTNYFGEKFVDFADFYIGVIEADVYAQYGDKTFTDNFDDWNQEYTVNANSTKRTTGLSNIVDLTQYQEGVNEKETIEFTVDQLSRAFWPTYNFEYGKEYLLLVALDGEVAGYVEHPVLKNATMVSYKKVLLQAEFVESNWKGADFKFSLAGYTHYNIGWVSTQMVEEYIGYGVATSVEDFIPFYINGMGFASAGAIVPVENIEIGETVALADLANRSFYEWAPELMTDTEYYLFVYPFNAPNGESDFQMQTATVDNVINFGTFKTGSIEVGDFDAQAQFEIVSWQKEYIEEWYDYYDVLTVNATFGSVVTDIVYAELYGPAQDSEEGMAEVMNSYYKATAKVDGGVTIKIVYPSDPTYLGVVAINAEGKAVYVEAKLEKPLPPATDVTAVSVAAEQGHYSENGGCYHNGEMKVTFTLPNDENAVIYFKTGNNEAADFTGCDAYHRPAYDYLYVGDWFDWNKSTNGKWYLDATLNGVDAVIYGPIVVGYGAEGYTFSFQIDGYKVTYTGNVPGLTVPEGYEGGEPEEPAYDYDVVFTKCVNAGNTYTFTNDEGYTWVMALTNPLAEGALVDEAGNWDGNSTTIQVPGADYPGYCYNGTFTVAKDGDNYAISFITDPWINNAESHCRFTFNGTIETPSAEGPDLTGYNAAESASVDYKSDYGTVRFLATYLDSVVLQVYPFFGTEDEVHFNVGEWQVEKLTLAGFPAQSGKVDLYKQADGSYLVMVNAEFQTVGSHAFYFYVTL